MRADLSFLLPSVARRLARPKSSSDSDNNAPLQGAREPDAES